MASSLLCWSSSSAGGGRCAGEASAERKRKTSSRCASEKRWCTSWQLLNLLKNLTGLGLKEAKRFRWIQL